MLTEYKNNFNRLSNLISEKDPNTKTYLLDLAKEIGGHLNKFK